MNLPLILRVFKNGQIQEVKQFHLDQIVFGRNAEVDLDLDDSQVSPIHAMIEKRENRFYICDLGSQVGTFKNGTQILDEPIDSGDEIQIGQYSFVFNVGVPRPKMKNPNIGNTVEPKLPLIQPTFKEDQPTIEVKRESKSANTKSTELPVELEIPETKQMDFTEVTQEIEPISHHVSTHKPSLDKGKQLTKGLDQKQITSTEDADDFQRPLPLTAYQLIPNKKTFPPPSKQLDLNKVVKPSRGTVLEISLAWKERVFETYHFDSSTTQITIGNTEKVQIDLPASLVKGPYKIVENFNSAGATINVRQDMSGDLITQLGVVSLTELDKKSRLTRRGVYSQLKLDQGEVLRLSLQGGQLNIYIRYVPQTPKPLLLPFVPLSIGEIASVLIAMALVGLLALYMTIHAPVEEKPGDEQEQMRVAQIIYQKPKLPPPEIPKPQNPPPPKDPVPVKPIEKVVLADKTQSSSRGNNSDKVTEKTGPKENLTAAGKNSPGQAAMVRPNQNLNRPKQFTSSKQGGAIKLGQQAGSNSQSQKPVDVRQLGLASALTGGGMRSRLDQAVSGAGGIIGDSAKATGSVGFGKSRPGEDFGSAFKDVGAGGKGTATEGIADGITKGRSTGSGSYGAEGSGLGNHRGVEVSSPGFGDFVGTIDKEGVRRVIKSKRDVIARCYEKELRFKSQLSGKLVLSFVLDDTGSATRVKVKSSDINDPNVESCIINEFQTWRFPEAPKGELAEVSYPFVFTKHN